MYTSINNNNDYDPFQLLKILLLLGSKLDPQDPCIKVDNN